MVNPAKYLVQAVLAGVNVIGRAFIQSYQRVAQGPSQSQRHTSIPLPPLQPPLNRAVRIKRLAAE